MSADTSQIELPKELPISQREADIAAAIRKHQVVIIQGETGSGKTTQIPKICLKLGLAEKKAIGCTQPRRVAALAVANRVEEELGKNWGHVVGSKIRFTDKTDRNTRIKIMTDGILLNEMQTDPLLKRYSVLVIDEAHERSLNIDFILGHLVQIRKKRKDLKIIITSATIDTEKFSEAFGGAPVIEVSGRMYPVEVRYHDFEDRDGSYTYIEASYDAVSDILQESRQGDLLVFLPAEKDIRELCDRLSGSFSSFCQVVPLFGRLTQAEQQQIFKATQRRKIVVATNIAETSITVPGIRYVVDCGLARISRYSAHTRTQRLPIEPISQSSANQRKGRCGRVAEGICIRLYSEEDYLNRPEFTSPEIFRSNLASVILRMKAFRFGEVEDFPFIDPPEARALQGGLILLKELSAIDELGELTETGRKLARLPIDPTVGRMLIEARKLNVMKSVIIIASALSIQDPRERPLDKEAQADQEHRKFRSKESDFLSLMKIWTEFDAKYEKWSQSKMRKFCKEHFISYQRLREWREIHAQIRGVLKDLNEYHESPGEDEPEGIHRAILSGLLGNIAVRDEGNWFKATRGRRVMVYPGSVLFEKPPKRTPGKPLPHKKEKDTRQDWIMASEFVETTQLYARTLAKVESPWIRAIAGHLMKYSYQEPHWSAKSQRVLVWRKEFLYGLQIEKKRVGFGTVDANAAKEIFIREGLMGETIRDHFSFLEHNQEVQEELSELQVRFRRSIVHDLESKLYNFYDELLPPLSSVAELHKWWRSLTDSEQTRAFLDKGQLLLEAVGQDEAELFPEYVIIGGVERRLEYRFEPNSEEDGATLKIPLSEFAGVSPGSMDWMIPGYVPEKVEILIKSLPKDYRKALSPIKQVVENLMAQLKPNPKPLLTDLAYAIAREYSLKIPPAAWNVESIPENLRIKIKLLDDDTGKAFAHSSDWSILRQRADALLEKKGISQSQITKIDVWKEVAARWEKTNVLDWNFKDLPAALKLGNFHGVDLIAYPGLQLTKELGVSVRLFSTRRDALKYTPLAYKALCEHCVGRDLGWFRKDLKKLKPAYIAFADIYAWAAFETDCDQLIVNALFLSDIQWPLTRTDFEQRMEQSRRQLRAAPAELQDLLNLISESRSGLLNSEQGKHPYAQNALTRLFPQRFLRAYSWQQLQQIPRYIKATLLRIERARQHPLKEKEKALRVSPYTSRFARIMKYKAKQIPHIMLQQAFFALEELRVSVFAQELGTHGKISEKIVDEMLKKIEDY